MGSLDGKYKNENNDKRPRVQINSLDNLVSIDRLPIYNSNALGIYLYGADNNYPRKITEAAKRCSSLVTVKNKQAQFIQGLGFPGATAEDVKNDTAIIINEEGDTAYDLLKFCAKEKTDINIAIHVNYNMLGEAVEFTPIQYDFVRRKIKRGNEKFDRYIIADIWHLENNYQQYGLFGAVIQKFNEWIEKKKENTTFAALECFSYNPDPIIVREQIELAGGIDSYSGQLLYVKDTRDVYQAAKHDCLADKFQFLAECDLESISNIQNGYSGSGVFKYPSNGTDSKEIAEIKNITKNQTGAANRGRFLTIGLQTQDNIPTNLFESTQTPSIDKLYENQTNRAEAGIQQHYSIPNSLIGKDSEGNFATQKMQEAFDMFNSVTSQDRQDLEIILTMLFKNSVFKNQVKLPIEIEPLKYISRTEGNVEENEKIRKESQARLKGTVGGVQGVLQIQQSVSQGLTQYEAGIEILKDIYGYEDKQARNVLGEPIQQFSETQDTIDETTEKNTTENDTTDND